MATFESLTLDEFREEVVKFRQRMGDSTLSEDQRHGIYRALTLEYFATMDNSEKSANLFFSTSCEYTSRMLLMGMEP